MTMRRHRNYKKRQNDHKKRENDYRDTKLPPRDIKQLQKDTKLSERETQCLFQCGCTPINEVWADFYMSVLRGLFSHHLFMWTGLSSNWCLRGHLVVHFFLRDQVKGRDFSIEQKGFIPQYKLVTSSATPGPSHSIPCQVTRRGDTRRRLQPAHLCSFLYITPSSLKHQHNSAEIKPFKSIQTKIIAQINKPILQKRE